MKHFLFSFFIIFIIAFSNGGMAQNSDSQINVVKQLATRLNIHATLPGSSPLPPSTDSSVTLENIKISEGGLLFQYKIVLNTYIQSHTCDLGKIEAVSLMFEYGKDAKTLRAIGTGPARTSSCPEYYSMSPTKIVFTSGIYFYDKKKTVQSETFVIDNSGLKILITALKGKKVTAKLEKIETENKP